ncbi:MAG TPA: hypothetical protein VH988_23595 [Thermoanaerobaculia bacterium]|jgi:hypothetical protein|nr:hypothetical protein [Thermoanaerobaculia bacterium]
MKRKLWPLAVVVALAACRGSLAPDAAPQPSDLTVDQLIAKYETARGGDEKLKGIRSVKMTGTWELRGSGASPVTVMITPGHYLRRIEQSSGKATINAVDGQTTWSINPQLGLLRPSPMVPKDAARFRRLADPQGPLVDSQAKGNKVEVVGKLPWHDSQVYKLKVTFSDGAVSHLYLDAKSFLPVRFVGSLLTPDGQDIDIEYVYEDFRDVDGIKWPFVEKANAPSANFTQTISWKTIEVNQPLDESAFKAPAS